jgi:hypothetical protein
MSKNTITQRPEAPPRQQLHQRLEDNAADFGTDAVLLVPFDPIGSDVSTWTYRPTNELPAGLHVEVRQNQPTGGGAGYVATVEGINVYTAQLPPDRVWLFSARTLRSIL